MCIRDRKIEGRIIQKNNSGPELQNWEQLILLHDAQQLFSKALEEKFKRSWTYMCGSVWGYTGKVRFRYRLLSVLYRSESGTCQIPYERCGFSICIGFADKKKRAGASTIYFWSKWYENPNRGNVEVSREGNFPTRLNRQAHIINKVH